MNLNRLIKSTLILILIISFSSFSFSYDLNYYYKKYDIIKYGKYEQDHDPTNGKEDIEWIVLDIKPNKILLVSKYILDCKQYHIKDSLVYWKDSNIRAWLNSTFIFNAFNEDEISNILDTYVINDTNIYTNEFSGENTIDKVFILSLNEAIQYFDVYGNDLSYSVQYGLNKNGLRKAKGTKQAIKNNLRVIKDEGDLKDHGNYWLRTVGLNKLRVWYGDVYAIYYNTYVRENGSINELGTCVRSNDDGVRPCIWLRY